jgi:hypothetical protein
MRKIGTGLAALLLAGCGSSESGTIETEEGTVEYDAEQRGDGAEMRFTDEQGNETVITSGADVATRLPDGFTVYPGSQLGLSTAMSGNEGQGNMLVMTSSDTPQQMVAHYRREAEAAGFTVDMEMTSGDTMVIGGERSDGMGFSFNASTSPEGTNGMLMVGAE